MWRPTIRIPISSTGRSYKCAKPRSRGTRPINRRRRLRIRLWCGQAHGPSPKSAASNCHGGSGLKPGKFSEGLNPAPNLDKVINGLQPQEVFWIIKNGIKMTGMPSFGAEDPPVADQTIWTIVAFVKKLPSVSDQEFKAWSAAPPDGP